MRVPTGIASISLVERTSQRRRWPRVAGHIRSADVQNHEGHEIGHAEEESRQVSYDRPLRIQLHARQAKHDKGQEPRLGGGEHVDETPTGVIKQEL